MWTNRSLPARSTFLHGPAHASRRSGKGNNSREQRGWSSSRAEFFLARTRTSPLAQSGSFHFAGEAGVIRPQRSRGPKLGRHSAESAGARSPCAHCGRTGSVTVARRWSRVTCTLPIESRRRLRVPGLPAASGNSSESQTAAISSVKPSLCDRRPPSFAGG